MYSTSFESSVFEGEMNKWGYNETIRDAYHGTMGHRRYGQQVQLKTHTSLSTIQLCVTISALIFPERWSPKP